MSAQADQPEPPMQASSEPASPELHARVEKVLGLIRPAVREDGGDIELVSVSADGLVQIRFHGACVGCPSAPMTLHHGIERALRSELDGVKRVEAVR
ncbi:MAG: NifU family protein [Phycisphaerales bacterium]